MKTIAQQLNVTDFPFVIKNKDGNEIYWEDSKRNWFKSEYDSNGNLIYYEDSKGQIVDNRPKGCEGTIVDIKGKKYKLTELT